MTASSGTRHSRSKEAGSPALAAEMGAIGAAESLCGLLLAGGDEAEAAAALNDQVEGLRLSWDPQTQELPTTAMRATQDYWQSLPRTAGIPEVLQVEPARGGQKLTVKFRGGRVRKLMTPYARLTAMAPR